MQPDDALGKPPPRLIGRTDEAGVSHSPVSQQGFILRGKMMVPSQTMRYSSG